MSELTFTHIFLSFVLLFLIIGGMLSLFFTNLSYNIVVDTEHYERDAFVYGNALLFSPCLTDGTKGLFIQEKLNMLSQDPSCLKGYDAAEIDIRVFDTGDEWDYTFKDPLLKETAVLYIAIKMLDNSIKLGTMTVKL